MCAEIFDVFVFCSLSGRIRASWAMFDVRMFDGANVKRAGDGVKTTVIED